MFQHVPNWPKTVQNLSNMVKSVQKLSNFVQHCPKWSKIVQIVLNCWTFIKIVQNYQKLLNWFKPITQSTDFSSSSSELSMSQVLWAVKYLANPSWTAVVILCGNILRKPPLPKPQLYGHSKQGRRGLCEGISMGLESQSLQKGLFYYSQKNQFVLKRKKSSSNWGPDPTFSNWL